MPGVVGIFSRDCVSCFGFLADALSSELAVRQVRSFIITNNGFQRFQDEVSRCDCAVLYHTRNRGRVNITDVTNSLYDEEIEYLSETLGKENVIVVADDLDSSSSEMKETILQNQPRIRGMADEFFLISKADKNSPDLMNKKLKKMSSHIAKKVSKRNEQIRSITKAVVPFRPISAILGVVSGPMRAIIDAVIHCVTMVMGLIHLFHNTTKQCVMMVVQPVVLIYGIIYDTTIQCLLVVVQVVEPVCRTILRVRGRNVPR
ncbi:uncharacterized protein RB166_015509 [Leptodactylus fuscus]|uniref:uncharacterized protein LOC142217642 n=1 Tax=Leptodactylus fuscus TaxID=238119 RepID=UPI003F4E8AD6